MSSRLVVVTLAISKLSGRLYNHRVVKGGRDLLRWCNAIPLLKAQSAIAGCWGHIQSGFEYFQEWGLYHFSDLFNLIQCMTTLAV